MIIIRVSRSGHKMLAIYSYGTLQFEKTCLFLFNDNVILDERLSWFLVDLEEGHTSQPSSFVLSLF
jgi:hypothetical protein